ncbi:MAG TPA: hypothetical protein VNS46_09420 [Nocardioides sp.]|nr:hypothetical protein [Nocardioides sp.]
MSENDQEPSEAVRVDPDDDTGQSLPPPPKPFAEPPAPPPGGPNAIEGVGGDGAYSTEPHDPDPLLNPATDDELPPETLSGEDTDTAATRGDPDVPPAEESPA